MKTIFFTISVLLVLVFAGCFRSMTRDRVYKPFDTLGISEFYTYDNAGYYSRIQFVSNKMLYDSAASHLNVQASDSTYQVIQYSFNGYPGIYKYSYGIIGNHGGEYFTVNKIDSKQSRTGIIPEQMAGSFLKNACSATNENHFLVHHCVMYSASNCLVVKHKGLLVYSVVYGDEAQIANDYAYLKDYLELVY